MPVYEYAGLNSKGKNISGIIDADSIKTARQKLRKGNIYPISIVEDRSGKGTTKKDSHYKIDLFQRIKSQDIALMTRQLSTLIGAGLPIVDALNALIEQTENPNLERILTRLKEAVNEGKSLADAMKEHPSVFSNLFINMTFAGETSGALEIVLSRMADFVEKQLAIKNKLITIMAYPVVMFLAGSFVLAFLIGYVIPKVTEIFAEINQSLPLPTVILINVSNIINDWWWAILLTLLVILIAVKRYIKTEPGRRAKDTFCLKLPLFGELIKKLAISRFSRTLGMLIKSGMSITGALTIVTAVVNNTVIAQIIDNAKIDIESGEGIAATLKKSGIFPPIVTHMIAIGEKSGNLEEMLFKISDVYEDEVQTFIQTITAIIEPIMILFMGALVGFIVVSILLPIFEMNQMIG